PYLRSPRAFPPKQTSHLTWVPWHNSSISPPGSRDTEGILGARSTFAPRPAQGRFMRSSYMWFAVTWQTSRPAYITSRLTSSAYEGCVPEIIEAPSSKPLGTTTPLL